MSSIQALREQRAAKAKALKVHVEKKDWNPETDQPIYDQGLAELDALDGQIGRIQAVNERIAADAVTGRTVEAAERVANDSKSAGAKVFAKWLRGGDQALTAEDWAIVRNTMDTTTNSEGGYTVATEVAKTVLDALKAYGGMRKVATVIRTTMGNSINYPTSDGTSETGEIVAQNAGAASADATFGVVGLPVYKYSSKVITVPFELLQDSNVDIEAFVRGRLVTRLGRITNTHFTVGDGSSKPNGVVTAAGTGVTAANATSQVSAVTYDSLVDLQHSVDPAYRELGNCRFMMHDQSVKVVRKIKDSNGRPIFIPGYETAIPGVSGSIPATLLGDPIQVNQDMATMAANAKSIAYGDFSFYTIRDVMDVSMFRFTDSAYTKNGQVGFLAWLRSGGNFVDVGGAVKLFINAAT